MKLIFGDLLAIDEGIILHQCNTKGIMGKGIASFLDKKYPGLEKETKYHIKMIEDAEHEVFGAVYYHIINSKLKIGNCFSEIGMCSNRKPGDPPNTSYDAVIKCFDAVKNDFATPSGKVYLPFKYGCGLAGGDWDVMLAILKNYDFNVVARQVDYEEWINQKFVQQ